MKYRQRKQGLLSVEGKMVPFTFQNINEQALCLRLLPCNSVSEARSNVSEVIVNERGIYVKETGVKLDRAISEPYSE